MPKALSITACASLAVSSAAPAFAQLDHTPSQLKTRSETYPPAKSLINPDEKLANIEAAIRAYQDGNYTKASSLAKSAYNAGSMDGAVLLGHMNRKGELGAADYAQARQWYEKAAALSHPDALMALADMGLNAQGGLSKTDAAGFLSRAADRGRTEAMLVLSDLYMMGEGVPKDQARAREYLTRGTPRNGSKNLRRAEIQKDSFSMPLPWQRAKAWNKISRKLTIGCYNPQIMALMIMIRTGKNYASV